MVAQSALLVQVILFLVFYCLGVVREGRMKDVLVGATQEAGAMIEENLNGISFANSRMALANLAASLQRKKEYIESIKAEISQTDAWRRQDLWNLVQHEVSVLHVPNIFLFTYSCYCVCAS